ncbi:class I SAM-dependent methyltransferase [Limosilactobacillus equigenerosi]|uniref:Methyltransferase type 11 domain-containing protein n=1 Tax=Limosilactobacillus equigenerosi DSM 18793 = JCM 14505 TaxID=1423742 RepID=A0A0R1UFT2_9LACO|nr:class I SAM-dependent methyltransferase [Limosilactobacillus equigenerosi]KRL92255.1 hypothetical protein FC21_GL000407 [Limosilactobacillus equigenerosi DSM 18793 = JCM 14505]
MKKGIDSPGTLLGLIAISLFAIWQYSTQPHNLLAGLFMIIAIGSAWTYFHTTWYGKYKIVKQAVADSHLASDQRVLDLGTGHGLMLLNVAKYLQVPGQVIGIDIWSQKDQSNNHQSATETNILQAGVSEVAKVQTADMTKLPFDADMFDLVTASLSIHNLKTSARKQALAEATRVLKPGGRILIIDIIFSQEYQKQLQALGYHDIKLTNAGYNGWWGGPWMGTTVITATK